MKKILKKDLFIVRKSCYWWLLLLVCMLFVCMFISVKHFQAEIVTDNVQNVTDNFSETSYILDSIDDTIFSYCEFIICSDILLMFIGVFSILLSLQEFQNNYIKNVWLCEKNKNLMFFSKFIVLALYIFIVFCVSIIVISILAKFVFGINQVGNIKLFIQMCIKQYILELAFGSLVMFIALLIRKQTGVIIGFVIYVALGQTLIYSGIDLIVEKILNLDNAFAIGKYLLLGNIQRITMEAENIDSMRAVFISVIAILCFSFGSCLSLRKRAVF